MHELNDLFQIILSAAEKSFAYRYPALSPSATSHLPQECRSNEVTAHASVVQDNSSSRSPSCQLSPMEVDQDAYRLIPAARLQVAMHTSIVPESYAAAIRSLSSVVKPA